MQRGTLGAESPAITGLTITDHLLLSSFRLLNRDITILRVSSTLRSFSYVCLENDRFFVFYIIADPENCLIVHCNSGKGRTGTAICAILLFLGYFDNVDDCLRFYGHQRFTCGKGVS